MKEKEGTLMRLQGAIFDMDGTLLDSMPTWKTLWYELLRELGADPSRDIEREITTLNMADSAAYCVQKFHLQQTPGELADLANARMSRFYAGAVRPKPGVEKVLSLLKMQGVWMYVATSTDRPQAELALRSTGLDGYFRGLLTAAETGAGKDSPVIFEKCLTRLRCRREDCVVFEDTLTAVRTAKAAGFRVAAVYDAVSEADQPALRELADYYLRSFEELLSDGAW